MANCRSEEIRRSINRNATCDTIGRMGRTVHAGWICVAAVLAACGSDRNACVPGATVECACPGGAKGAQACTENGKGYATCSCVAAAGANDPGLAVGEDAERPGNSSRERSDATKDTQRAEVKKYVYEGFLDWARRNPTQGCPSTLSDVAAAMGQSDTKDVWGNEMLMFCGDTLPAGAQADGFAVMSVGPDGRQNTGDDVKSWEPNDATAPAATATRTSSPRSRSALGDLEALRSEACACRDADCANKVQEHFETWAKNHSDTKGSQTEADKAGKIAEEISKCMVRAMTGDQPSVQTGTGLPGCDALIAAYAQLAKCKKMPRESRDAMAQGLDAMKQGWGDTSKMDDATKRMMNDSCQQGLDGLKQTMSATGC